MLLKLVFRFLQATTAAHIPLLPTDAPYAPSIDDSGAPYDTDTSGETENNRMGLLQQLLELRKKTDNVPNEINTDEGLASVPRSILEGGAERKWKGVKEKDKPITTTTTTSTTTQVNMDESE